MKGIYLFGGIAALVDIDYKSSTQIYYKIDKILTEKHINKYGFDFNKTQGPFEIHWKPNKQEMWTMSNVYPLMKEYYRHIFIMLFKELAFI